ncbi:MAG: APC family permease [Gemmatimonadota bacterium]|nr:APC family permease [Gemmatimonadota bacterium]
MLRRSLTTLPLVFVIFFNVSGGATTLEGLVAATGPGLALAILIVIPFVWALPEIMIIGELASMLPEEGGYYRWVRRAFGDFWAFQNGWYTWLYSLVDMAIYPALLNLYLAWFVPELSPMARWLIALLMIWGAAGINLRGAFPVGRVSVAAGLLVLGAFLLVAIFAVPNMTHVPWQPFQKPGQGLSTGLAVGLSTALWNYFGWDNASTVGGEVVDAGRTYPRALAFALPLVTLSYLVPLVPALGATDWTTWREGSWPAIAAAATGPAGVVLAPLLAIAGMVSAVALFNALLMSYTRIPLALAQDRLLPAVFSRTDARGTPYVAILVSAAIYSVFVLVPFGNLVVADAIFYAAALMLEFASLVWFRVHEPQLRGPFRIPLGTTGVAALAFIPFTVFVTVIVISFHDGEYGFASAALALVAMVLGVPWYFIVRRLLRAR